MGVGWRHDGTIGRCDGDVYNSIASRLPRKRGYNCTITITTTALSPISAPHLCCHNTVSFPASTTHLLDLGCTHPDPTPARYAPPVQLPVGEQNGGRGGENCTRRRWGEISATATRRARVTFYACHTKLHADLFPSSLLPQRSSLSLQAHRIDLLDLFHAQPPP